MKHSSDPKYTGPRSSFYECIDVKSAKFVCAPRSWGPKVLKEVKDGLVAQGWHSNLCSDSGAQIVEFRR
ncbi:hypothetical protein GUITHDRAFT_153396 [Guillardia theta CCMP2712]|uniref:Uncharacterized protein n=1 Tax=Guillardia theta (strain CCMP2712) TaxID=905079 RepID=L1J328_GUITC|nr:hypothetical protein GUITHDRAFT_153396 [Guillardia theta CCMP2712]EKX42928.1 hypothetical protein GUITHDRAFT_153396 [Guillardia theta CCMP2712]|eukprot:XP_005829908.1 hypothetical protein GUITHDRAFT_153396 [Guillardia theta CCMP2712]